MDARVLAAADVYQALVSDHPHRPAHPPAQAELFIAASTVHTHITHIYDKAGVSTRAGAAVFAMEHGLIHPAPAT